MEIGSCTRVPNGSCRTSYLTRASCIYEQSIPSQNRTLSVSSNVKFPCKKFNCKATLKEANNNIEAVGKMELANLTAISPLDGCYWNKVKDLSSSLSEYGLIYYRTVVEWLLKLSEIPEVVEVPSFSNEAQSKLQGLIDGFSEADAIEVKNIEKITNHDVKAVEYFLKRKREEDPEITKVLEFFHFGCTSEDINNLAHGLMLKEAVNSVILQVMDDLLNAIYTMAKANAHIPMLSRTHEQPASPTTLGKEMVQVGNYNAHVVTYPDVNWPNVVEQFVNSLGLSFNPYIIQIEPHDYMAKLFHSFIRVNNILILIRTYGDISLWDTSSRFTFQVTKAGEIRSSTMPHKVNPIDFENSEGNLGIANAVLDHLSMKLPISRWRRDLTDSMVLRNIGVWLGYSLLAYKSALEGIGKLQVNEAALNKDLDNYWEVLAKPIQTVMRRYAVEKPYEKLKELTRGKTVNRESISKFINGLEIGGSMYQMGQ